MNQKFKISPYLIEEIKMLDGIGNSWDATPEERGNAIRKRDEKIKALRVTISDMSEWDDKMESKN